MRYLIVLALASCFVVVPSQRVAQQQQQVQQAPAPGAPASKIVSAQSGSKTAAAYDDTTQLLASADDETATAPAPAGHAKTARLLARSRQYAAAERAATDILISVKEMKQNGQWRAGLSYAVTGNETLTEQVILQRLYEMERRAKSSRERLGSELAAAYRSEFPKASEAQLDALRQYGLPVEITAGRRGESCWKFGDATTTCWTKHGAIASRAVERPPAEAPEPRPVAARVARLDPNREDHPIVVHAEDHPATLSWLRSSGDCRGIASHNSGLCDSSDCRGIADRNSGLCDTNDCRAIASDNSGLCDTNDCRGIAGHNSGLCDSNDCRGIASGNSGLCDSGNCRAIASGNSGLCD